MPQSGGPPDTSVYYRVAYAWAAALYAGYSVILWVRARRLRTRLAARTQATVRDV